MILKTLLAVSLLSAPVVLNSENHTFNSYQGDVLTEEAADPRLWGELTSTWLTSTDGRTQARFKFTHEIATNTIIYINGIVGFQSTSGETITNYWISNNPSINGNRATIVVGYTIAGSDRHFQGTFQLVV